MQDIIIYELIRTIHIIIMLHARLAIRVIKSCKVLTA